MPGDSCFSISTQLFQVQYNKLFSCDCDYFKNSNDVVEIFNIKKEVIIFAWIFLLTFSKTFDIFFDLKNIKHMGI